MVSEKKKEVKNKNLRYFVILVLVISLLVFIYSLVNYVMANKIIESQTYYASVIVSDKAGFDLNDSALTFGSLIKGSSSTRNLIYENNRNFSVIVEINSLGNISELLVVKSPVLVDSGDTKKILFSVFADEDTQEGNYEGFVLLETKKYRQ